MNKRTIAYWIVTGFAAFVFLSGGLVDIARPGFATEGMRHLGYPDYFMVILGAWKVLGGIVVLIPGTPLLKEWSYAGMFFDLSGASASHASSGDPILKVLTPSLILLVVIASWALRPASRKVRTRVTGFSDEATAPAA